MLSAEGLSREAGDLLTHQQVVRSFNRHWGSSTLFICSAFAPWSSFCGKFWGDKVDIAPVSSSAPTQEVKTSTWGT